MKNKNIAKITAASIIISNSPTAFAAEVVDNIIDEVVNNISSSHEEDSKNQKTDNVIEVLEDTTSDSDSVIYNEIIEVNEISYYDSNAKTEKTTTIESEESKYSGGHGTEVSPYLIGSAQDLIDLSNDINNGENNPVKSGSSEVKYYKLIGDISLEGYDNFIPIGTYENPFTGVFDGNNYTISNLELDSMSKSNLELDSMSNIEVLGLFGCVRNSRIQNVNLESFSIKGDVCVGALVGIAFDNNHIENVHTTNISIDGICATGGLVGFSSEYTETLLLKEGRGVEDKKNSSRIVAHPGDLEDIDTLTIANSSVEGNILFGLRSAGGFVGESWLNVDIYNCESNISIDVFEPSRQAYIEGSFASGFVRGTFVRGSFAGGFVGCGRFKTSIVNSHSTVSISDVALDAGGLIGYGRINEITNASSKGDIHGFVNVGGLIGRAYSASIDTCKSEHNLLSIEATGGIIGCLETYDRSKSYIKNTTVNSTIKSYIGAGGLIGASSSDIFIGNSNF